MATKEHWIQKVEYYSEQAQYHNASFQDVLGLLLTILTFLIDWRYEDAKA